MAGTLALLLSALGGRVRADGDQGETVISAKADGTAVPGQVVGIIATAGATQGDIAGTDDGAFEFFTGILLEKYDQDCDAAITDGELCEVLVPKSGVAYNIAITDPGADKQPGLGFVFSTTAGNMTPQADIVVLNRASSRDAIADTSRFATLIWT